MKKLIMLFSLLILSNLSKSQDTIFYNEDWLTIEDAQKNGFMEIIQHYPNDSSQVLESIYYDNGQLKSYTNYSSYRRLKAYGTSKEWYKNGMLALEINFVKGKKNGILNSYWENGKLRRTETYSNDTLIEGKCYNSEGKEIPHFEFEKMPEFPGGNEKMYIFLGKEIKYPPKARESKISGKVILSFNLDKKGCISDIIVTDNPNDELSNESIRVIKKMPLWSPMLREGEPVRTKIILPIRFQLG
jgi:protein TonB